VSGVALYQLATEYREAADKLADLDLDPQTLADTLESMTGDLELKAANVAMFIRGLGATIAAMKDAEAAMKRRRESAEARQKAVSLYLLNTMQACKITKIDHPMLRISVRANPPAVDVFDAAQIPASFMATPEPSPPPAPYPDKALIKASLEGGGDVPGARLTRGYRLDIK
jgi:hypothetical protein